MDTTAKEPGVPGEGSVSGQHVKIGNTAWPSARGRSDYSDDITWSLCYAKPLSMESRHLAASYVQAYRQLVMMPAQRRAQIIRELRAAANSRDAGEGGA